VRTKTATRRRRFAAAIYTGLRKAELAASRAQRHRLPAANHHGGEALGQGHTSGGHHDVIPIHPGLVPLLEEALVVRQRAGLPWNRARREASAGASTRAIETPRTIPGSRSRKSGRIPGLLKSPSTLSTTAVKSATDRKENVRSLLGSGIKLFARW
jgi:hypothetical protein